MYGKYSIPVSIHATYTIYAKYTVDEAMKDMDEVEIIYIARDDQFIDITQFIYDYVHLSIPVHVFATNPAKQNIAIWKLSDCWKNNKKKMKSTRDGLI
jgi:uncharacterized metal-binding protein YceD (DUF177 family)